MTIDKPKSICMTTEQFEAQADIIRLGGEAADKLFRQLHADAVKLWHTHPAEIYAAGIYRIENEAAPGGPIIERVMDIRQFGQLKREVEHSEHLERVYYAMDFAQQVLAALRDHQRTAENALSKSKAFREEVIIWMRALALIADSIGNAGTHAEKNARIRGLCDLIESAVGKLKDFEFDYGYYTDWSSIFRSDFPVKYYVGKHREAQTKIEELEAEIAKLKGEPVEVLQSEDDEF